MNYYNTTLQYSTTVLHYNTPLQYYTSVLHYSTTLQYSSTVHHYRCGCTQSTLWNKATPWSSWSMWAAGTCTGEAASCGVLTWSRAQVVQATDIVRCRDHYGYLSTSAGLYHYSLCLQDPGGEDREEPWQGLALGSRLPGEPPAPAAGHYIVAAVGK